MNKPILVNSLAKSGTNYVAKILENIGYKQSSSGFSYQSIVNRGFLLRALLRGGWKERSPLIVGIDTKVPFSSKWIERKLSSVGQGEYISSHLNYSDSLYDIVVSQRLSVLQVIRHPCDVLVSYKDFVLSRKDNPLNGDFSKMSERQIWEVLIRGGRLNKIYLDSLRSRLLSVQEWFNKDIVSLVRYEDILPSSENLKEVVSKLSYELGVSQVTLENAICNSYGKSHTFHTGIKERYKKSLPAEFQQEVNDSCGDILNGWNYKI